ncbi:MAG TPA: WD40 repeat domain-containing protein, partial [Abditibacterium sp.]
PLLFTPDATRLFVSRPNYGVGDANRVQMLAIPSGKPLRAFPLPSAPLWSDGKRLRGLKNGRVIEFDLTTGKQRFAQALQNAPAEKRSPLRWNFSPNGAYVSEGSAGVIRFWSARDGRLLGQIKDPLRAIGKTAISGDGLWLASEGDDPGWSPPNEAASEAAYARTFKIHVWNARTRKLFRTFEGYYSLDGGARLLRFPSDATTLFGAGSNSGLDRFRLKTGVTAPLPPAQKDFRRTLDWPIAVSNDGQWLGGSGQIYQSSDYAPGLQLWNIARGARQAIFAGTLRGADKVKWSPDGKFLAGGSRLTLWNAKTGQLLAEKPDSYLHTFAWRSNTRLQSASFQFVNEWRVPDGQQLSQKLLSVPTKDELFGPYSDGANFSPDGQTFLTGDPKGRFGGSNGSLFVRDAQTFAVRREIKGFDTGFTELGRIVWLPDGKHILHGTKTGFELIDLESGERLKQWNDPIDPKFVPAGGFDVALTPLAVSGDGKLAAVRSTRDNSLLIYDFETHAFRVQLLTKAGYQARFLKDNHTLVLSGTDGLEWWDARGDGQNPLRVMRGAAGFGWDISPDEKLIAFGTHNTSNQGVEIWNVARGERVLTLFLLGGNSDATTLDWIALTPQGFYDASPNGEKRLRWRQNNAFWPIEKSRAHFKNPAKVRAALSSP